MDKRKKGGKCVKRTGYFKFFNRKTKNPFRMIGSYVGVLIFSLSSLIYIPQTIFGWIGLDQILVIPMADSIAFVWKVGSSFMSSFITIGISVTIVGFFIGYIIQLIIRAFRK